MNHLKKITLLGTLSLSAFYFGQDISDIKNTIDVYSNDQFSGTARYSAMAGSMGALGGDVSSINSNPAGLGVAISNDLSGTLLISSTKNKSTHAGITNDYSETTTKLGQISGMTAFRLGEDSSSWKFLNLAFNYSTYSLDDYTRTPGNNNIYETEVINGNNVNFAYNGHAYNRYGNKSNMNIAVGANYEHKIYLGASLNFKSASLEQGDLYEIIRSSDNNTAIYSKQGTPYSENSNGFSASLGAIGKIDKNFRFGLALETPTFWNIDRAYTIYANDNGWYSSVYNDEISFRSPFKTTLSAAFVADKNFALNVDVTTDLSTPKYTSNSDADTQLNNYFNSQYKKQTEVRIGGEYRIDALRLRAGYAYRSRPLKSENLSVLSESGSGASVVNLASPYLGDRQTISGGIGYDFKSFYIDAAIQNVKSNYDNAFFAGNYATVSGNDGVANANSITSKVKNTTNNILLTVGWKF